MNALVNPKTPAAKAAAEMLRAGKAKGAAALKESKMPKPGPVDPILDAAVKKHAAAEKEMDSILVPMSLAEVCRIMGDTCHPSDFMVSSMETLADQLDAISQFAENNVNASYETWQVVDNIVERMRLASRVTAWLLVGDNETPAAEVAP